METVSEFRRNTAARFQCTLGVIGHAPHHKGPDGSAWAYEPYVREMRIWADLFAVVRICSPPEDEPIGYPVAPYERTNVQWVSVNYSLKSGAHGRWLRMRQLAGLVLATRRAICDSDVIHLRSPGHFGLVGAVLVRLMQKPSITKWAGENGSYENEPLPSRFERWIQGFPHVWHPVLVYGPAKRSHQISFLPALMSDEEISRARQSALATRWCPPWQLCSVGRLDAVKGFDLALRGLGELRRLEPRFHWVYTQCR